MEPAFERGRPGRFAGTRRAGAASDPPALGACRPPRLLAGLLRWMLWN